MKKFYFLELILLFGLVSYSQNPIIIQFDFGKAELKDQEINKLEGLILKSDAQLLIVGEADGIGSELYNLNLAIRRAQAVEKYLKSRYPNIIASSIGETYSQNNTLDKNHWVAKIYELGNSFDATFNNGNFLVDCDSTIITECEVTCWQNGKEHIYYKGSDNCIPCNLSSFDTLISQDLSWVKPILNQSNTNRNWLQTIWNIIIKLFKKNKNSNTELSISRDSFPIARIIIPDTIFKKPCMSGYYKFSVVPTYYNWDDANKKYQLADIFSTLDKEGESPLIHTITVKSASKIKPDLDTTFNINIKQFALKEKEICELKYYDKKTKKFHIYTMINSDNEFWYFQVPKFGKYYIDFFSDFKTDGSIIFKNENFLVFSKANNLNFSTAKPSELLSNIDFRISDTAITVENFILKRNNNRKQQDLQILLKENFYNEDFYNEFKFYFYDGKWAIADTNNIKLNVVIYNSSFYYQVDLHLAKNVNKIMFAKQLPLNKNMNKLFVKKTFELYIKDKSKKYTQEAIDILVFDSINNCFISNIEYNNVYLFPSLCTDLNVTYYGNAGNDKFSRNINITELKKNKDFPIYYLFFSDLNNHSDNIDDMLNPKN